MRRQIVRAAMECDYARLARLAGAEDGGFIFTFGAERNPAVYWRQLEQGQPGPEEVLALLVKTLRLPHCTRRAGGDEDVLYQWPSAFCDGASEADWDALREAYPDEQIRQARQHGFFLHRVGITASGKWRFFVAGD